MLTRRLLLCVLVGLYSATELRAQGVNLSEAPLVDRCFRNEITMCLEGKITAKQDGKDVSFSHKATAKHAFMERCLDATGPIATKAARHYTTAESAIVFDNNDSSKRSLRAERRFLVAQRVKEQVVSFSPRGPLTREEMEVTEHFDTLAIAGLLPGKTIDPGKTWAIPNSVVLSMCELDGVTEQSLEGKLESVKDNLAQVTITGKANGINLGAQVEMSIDGRLVFDIKQKCIVSLEWKEADKRQQGPITPALIADVTIKLTRRPIDEPEQLNKFALVPVPAAATPPSNLTNLLHQDAKKRFELSYPRDWHVVSPEDSPQLVMRQIERGDFIGQATFTTWKKTDPKSVITLEKFTELMAKTPGWAEDKEIERKELKETAKGHHTVYRVAASGELDSVRTVQYFYLIVSPRGEQMIVTFSIVPQQVQRFGGRDLELVRDLIFPEK
jgi:hypothetical protein